LYLNENPKQEDYKKALHFYCGTNKIFLRLIPII
jgi:hypothetical protein